MAYTTRMSLLSRVRKGEEVSWEEFYKIYSKYFSGLCRKRGINENDLEDVVQDIIVEIYEKNKIEKYNKGMAKFRTYLFYVFRSNLTKYWRSFYKHNKDNLEFDEELFLSQKLTDLEKDWNKEWAKHKLGQALIELKNSIDLTTYQIFESYVCEGNSAKNVADFFDTTTENVYQIKHRTKKMLTDYINKNWKD